MKYWIGILFCLSGFFLIGCGAQITTTAPYAYVLFHGDRYLQTEEETFQFEDQTIVVDIQGTTTILTASFLEGTVTVSNGGATVLVDYPDGCVERYEIVDSWSLQTRFPTDGHLHLSSSHLALSAITVLSSADDPEEPVYLSWKRVGLIALGIFGMILTGIFVFRPGNTEKLVILENRILPMFEEPVRPTELHLTLRYLRIFIGFIVSLVILWFALFSKF